MLVKAISPAHKIAECEYELELPWVAYSEPLWALATVATRSRMAVSVMTVAGSFALLVAGIWMDGERERDS